MATSYGLFGNYSTTTSGTTGTYQIQLNQAQVALSQFIGQDVAWHFSADRGRRPVDTLFGVDIYEGEELPKSPLVHPDVLWLHRRCKEMQKVGCLS